MNLLGKGKEKRIVSGLGVVGDGNTIDLVGGWMEKENIKRDYWKGEDISEFEENLVQRILPGIYMDDFN